MDGVTLIEPTTLYNILNQGLDYPNLSDPNYLLLLDAREKDDYVESHILTAKRAPTENDEYKVPYNAELECKRHVIVYDSNTNTLKAEGEAISCARTLWNMGSRNPVQILKGGYEDFSALYPFLRTQKIIYMPRELDDIKTYPHEIIPGFLYLGNWLQGNAAYIQKDLKIQGHINCTKQVETFFQEPGDHLMHLEREDDNEEDLLSYLPTVCKFIDEHKAKNHVVLVFSKMGISTAAAVVIAYIMHHHKWTLSDSYNHVLKCYNAIRPNRGFVEQLSKWEESVHGETLTNIADPNF